MKKLFFVLMLVLFVKAMPAAINVVAPNGVTVVMGQEIEIRWSSTSDGRVSLIFTDQNGANRSSPFAKNLPSSGSYRYKVPDGNNRGYYRVKAFIESMGYTVDSGISQGYFQLETPSIKITHPSEGEYWVGGTDQEITWESDSYYGTVTISGSFGGSTINYSAPNSGSYSCTVPDYYSSTPKECWIYIEYNYWGIGPRNTTSSKDKIEMFFVGKEQQFQREHSSTQQSSANQGTSLPITSGFKRCEFPSALLGEWYCNGVWNYSIRKNNSLSIRTGNKFYAVLDTYTNGSCYQVFSKQNENGQLYTFFFTLSSSNIMQANLSSGYVNKAIGDFAVHYKK